VKEDMKCSPLELPLMIIFAVFTPNLSDWAILNLKPATIQQSPISGETDGGFWIGEEGVLVCILRIQV
jgi:hypothetical protein